LNQPPLVLGIGELLWDILPEGARLGGAPANFAVMAGRLGNHAAILSRIGRDELGRRAADQLRAMPVATSFLEIDPTHPTGRVTVSFSAGEPRYSIDAPAAWDFLELSGDWIQLAARADAICFGTLAQRSAVSRQTIQALVSKTPPACVRVFDVNLRAPFYSGEVIEESLKLATVIKTNEEEVPLVLELLGLPAEAGLQHEQPQKVNLHAAASALLAAFPRLEMAAITRGSRGSLLVKRDAWSDHPGISVVVADPVGAGDAFTAALIHYLLRGADLATLNEAGNRWGGWMASQSGAMPELPESVRDAVTAAIERAH
jgi:fructokinase